MVQGTKDVAVASAPDLRATSALLHQNRPPLSKRAGYANINPYEGLSQISLQDPKEVNHFSSKRSHHRDDRYYPRFGISGLVVDVNVAAGTTHLTNGGDNFRAEPRKILVRGELHSYTA